MLKGLSAIPNSELPPDKAFKAETGGASGSLFSILIGAIDKGIENSSNFGEFLTNASNRISMIGEAKEGDKTMLDALIPAAKASLNNPKNSLEEASLASREGAKRTVKMPAKKGRAKYVENAGIGHIDPGAFSTSEIISFVCNYIRIENEKTL